MKRLPLNEKKRTTKKSHASSESKDKKSTLIKTQSEIERELEIPSYDEFRIKDNDSLMDYDDEDVETKMIRLVFLKKKGENIKDKINIKRQSLSKKNEYLPKIQRIKKGIIILQNLEFKKKKKNFIRILNKKKTSLVLKLAANFIYKIKKYIFKTYVKNIYYYIFTKDKSEHIKDTVFPKNKNLMLFSPQFSNKKLKKFKFPNKIPKLELLTKKNNISIKKGGVENIFEKIEKEKEKEKFLEEKLKKLDNIKRKEKEYISRMSQKKKKLKQEIEFYKKNNNISDDEISQIKKNNDLSEKASNYFSDDNSSKLASLHLDTTIKTEDIFNVSRKKKQQKTTKDIKLSQIISSKKKSKKEREFDIYSLKSKKFLDSGKQNNHFLMKNTIRNIGSSKKFQKNDSKNLKVSMRLSDIIRKKPINPTLLKKPTKEEDNLHKSDIKFTSNTLLNDSENMLKNDLSEKTEEKKTNILLLKKELQEEDEYIDEEEGGEISDSKEDFIEIPENRYDYKESPSLLKNEKINLVEYDSFYKEQYFKNDLFIDDVDIIKDEEVEKIKKEINKLEIKQKLKEKRKLKEVNDLKGINTDQLNMEIQKLNEKYKNMKKEVPKKLDFNSDTTQDFVNKGRLLNYYFKRKKEKNFPKFSVESEEELGAQEIIDFKPLRKEELSRRYFDYCICFEQRKKLHDLRISLRFTCRYFVDNWIFENIATFITFVNCVLFFFSDPANPNDLWNDVDYYFLIFYFFEVVIKILTFSFYSAEDAYIKDYWNILDMMVVMIGCVTFIFDNIVGNQKANITGLNGLKAFRILKILKTMKRFKNLRKVSLALIASISRLWEILIVLFFLFLFFSVAGLQMWQGLFLRRCMNINYGYLLTDNRNTYLCSFDSDCSSLNTYGNTFICAKGYINPHNGSTNFDNIFYSLITVFLMVTLEGWADVFTFVSKAFKDKIYLNRIIIFVYFHAFIYIGAFYLINLFLAVTNSEFEHIERNRKELSEKKSFYELIKSRYDPKEKKKNDKKENEKKAKIKNDKKSDEALKNLYYKIKEEAFHIHKNRRGLPKVYSTVKDIYILANNKPEEIYLEKERIKNEEKNLCKDVKRRQKEIELLLKKNKIELDKSKVSSKKVYKTRTVGNTILKDDKNGDKKLNYKLTIKNNKDNEGEDDGKVNKNSTQNLKNNLSQINNSIDLTNIIKLVDQMDEGSIQFSLKHTLNYFKEIKIGKIFSYEKLKAEQKSKKADGSKNENQNNNQISFYENLEAEDKVEELKMNERNRKLNCLQKRKRGNPKNFQKPQRESSAKKFDNFFIKRISIKNSNNKKQLHRQLTCINDLMLSSLSGNSENNSDTHIKKKSQNRRFTHIHTKKNMKLTKLILKDFQNNLDNLSFENDLINNSLYLNTERKKNKLKDSPTGSNNTTNRKEDLLNKSIINTKRFRINEDLVLKSKFERPHSTLNYIIKYEDEQKYNVESIRFDLKKYLKKEAEKDKEFLNKDRRKSFLGFLEYAQYQKEQNELEDLIQKENEKDSSSSNYNNSSFIDNSLHFLEEESFLSRNNTISVDNIDILPDIKENQVYKNEYLLHENLKKNLDSNKLTQKIRAEIFDRESVNTNVDLTANELRKYYEELNKKLDEQLYVNKKKIRIRDNNTNCNISGIIKYTNYNKNLKAIKKDEENGDSEEEEEKNNNINTNNAVNKKYSIPTPNDSKKNLKNNILNSNQPELYSEKTKKIDRKSPRRGTLIEEEFKERKSTNKGLSSKKVIGFNSEEKNSEFPLLKNQKTLNILNLNTKNLNNKENEQKAINNNKKRSSNRSILTVRFKNENSIKDDVNKNKQKNMRSSSKKSIKTIGTNIKNKSFYFKAKSIEKNIKKYPKEDSKKFIVYEENKKSKDLLTTEQELIPVNLRGKKYYMNYLHNIMDIDLKVKDNFKVNHWREEILNLKQRRIPLKRLPIRNEAFYVFNNDKLNLKKYTYIYYTDYRFKEKELTYLTTKLKYLPLNIIVLMPKRLRNFGKYASKPNFNMLTLNNHINITPSYETFEKMHQSPLNFYPNAALISTMPFSYNPSEDAKSVSKYSRNNTHTNLSRKATNRGSLTMSSAFSRNNVIQKEISFKRDVFDKLIKKFSHFNYLTLSHYVLDEDKLNFKFFDSKRKEDILNMRKENNRKKYNRMNIKNEVENIILYDVKTKSHSYIKWSGEDVLYRQDPELNRKKWNNLISSLEDFNLIIWHQNGSIKRWQKIRYAFYVFANNDSFEYTILALVIINSLFLALEGNFLKAEYLGNLTILNSAFNIIFIFEFIVKILGLTPILYYSDGFSYLDTVIIGFTIIDMAIPGDSSFNTEETISSANSQWSFLRVLRIFRVIRITKVLRKLKSMRTIIISIKKSLTNVSYIIIILVLFIFIFQLLGMSLLYQNHHYQSFLEAFYTTYQILTLENWNSIFYETWPINKFCIFYFVFWIFIGNYILFNLFISILIQSFNEMDIEDEDDLTQDEKIERIYPLPDYLYKLKNNISENNYVKIHEQRRLNKDPMNNILFSSGTISTSKEGMNKSSSNFNVTNISKLTIESDEEEELAESDFTKSTEIKDEIDEVDTNDKKYTSIEKRMIKWQKINKIFKKNNCEDSLFLFSQSNGFRIFCMQLINHSLFDKFILLIIILSTVRLILDTFLGGYLMALIFDICDTVFNLIFLIEAIIKIIALGFAFDEGSYLRDHWNQMDVIIVLCSFIDFHNTFQKYFMADNNYNSIEFLKIMRLLRTLRPLRFISHNENLKLIVISLFDSALPIFSTLFILIVVLFMFSIVGISLFYSNFHTCYVLKDDGTFELPQGEFNANYLQANNIPDNMPNISEFCARNYNGIMDTGPAFKFANIADAFITSYVLSSMEGWPEIMNSYRIYQNLYGIFFVVFNLIVTYFCLNLFTGIMFKYFNEAFKREQKLASDDIKAAKYYDYLTQIMTAQSDYIIWKKPSKGTIKYYLREIVDSEYFENIMLGVIFFNFLMLCMSYENSSYEYTVFLKVNNKIITILFTVEFVLKLSAYGFKSFFYVSWNIFDFILVLISYIDWKFSDVEGIDSSFLRTFQLVRVLKVLRVSRVLRLIKALKGLEKLLQTLYWSFSALSHVLLLTVIIFGTFALMGCYLYDGDKSQIKIMNSYYTNDYFNFNNFYTSYLLIFRCSTGESWPYIMAEYAYGASGEMGYSFVFFILDNFFTSVILLNLLLMVTLQQYDEFTDKQYNPIDKFNSFIKDFNSAWNKFSTGDDDGYRIKKILAAHFLMELNLQKFFFPEKNKLQYANKYVYDLKLYYDKEDYVYYHDVIFKILYKLYGTKIDRDNPDNNLIFKTEKKILKQIRLNINNYLMRRGGRKSLDKNQKNILITLNPLTSHLCYKYSFHFMRVFVNYYKEHSQLYQQNPEGGSQIESKEKSQSIFDSSYVSGSNSNNKESGSNEDDNDNEEEEEESDESNESKENNDEDKSLNNKESESNKEDDKSSSYNMPDNNLYNFYKKNGLRKISENKSEKDNKEESNEDDDNVL